MLEFLFNKVAGPQDVARLIFYMHFSDFIFIQVKPCKVMFTKAYLEISQTSTMELFLLQLSHILKTFFCLFFLSFSKIRNYAMECRHHKKITKKVF